MTTVLCITMPYPKQSGGGKFTDALLQGVSSIPDTRIIEYTITSSPSLTNRLFNCLRGYVQGVTPATLEEIVAICEREGVSVLLAGYTFFGTLVRNIRKRLPNIRIISVAQNIETVYTYQMFRVNKQQLLPWALFQLAIWLNERRQLAISDYVFALNDRDAKDMVRLFGKTPNDTIGMVLPDSFSEPKISDNLHKKPYALFVGSFFPPNEFAVKWIAQNIAPASPIPIKIIGHGMEALKDHLQGISNLEIVGTVDNLSSYYHEAQFVISPIFHGSGMKVKTAEALMFGKRILGTPEALEGYDTTEKADIICCQTPDEFLLAMRQSQHCSLFSPQNRALYLKNHSMGTLVEKLQRAMACSR